MKKLFVFVLFCFSAISSYAQWDFSAAMGLDFKSASSYRDYINNINYNYGSGGKEISSFSSAVNFSGEVGYQLSKTFQLGLEYSILIDSYNSSVGNGGVYEISYYINRPSLLGYYVLKGEGYKFKFGGGIGIRLASLTEKIISSIDYNASGFGVLLKAEGNTLLSDNLYALIGVDLRYDMTGELSNANNQKIVNKGINENLNLNSIGVGIKIGIAYLL